MPKKKNTPAPVAVSFEMPQYTAEQQESEFKRDYGFRKPVPARSPVNGWEYNYIKNNSPNAKERKFVVGTPYSNKRYRLDNSYSSRPATRTIKSKRV